MTCARTASDPPCGLPDQHGWSCCGAGGVREWVHRELAVVGPTIDEITAVTLKNRINSSFDSITRSMSMTLYGDSAGYVPPTRWQRWRRYWAEFPERARDAWLVLKGNASIYDD